MSEHDRQMWLGHAQALREELAQINPDAPWNRQRIADRVQELARLETKLARESECHATYLARRSELAARFYAFAAKGGH